MLKNVARKVVSAVTTEPGKTVVFVATATVVTLALVKGTDVVAEKIAASNATI